MKFYQVVSDDNTSEREHPVTSGNIYLSKSQAIQELLTHGFMLIPNTLKSATIKYCRYKFYKPYSFQLADYTEFADIEELTLVEHDIVMDNLTTETIEENAEMIEEFLNANPNLEVSEVDL